jgi:hypothetical protein
MTPESHEEYLDIANRSRLSEEQDDVQQSPLQQKRKSVSKQALYSRNGKRMQARLSSSESELIYCRREGELVENFKELECIFQEFCSSDRENVSNHVVRKIKANRGSYSYRKGKLFAEDASLAEYFPEENEWPSIDNLSSPQLEGRAAKICLSFMGEYSLNPEEFQTSLFEWEGEKR